MNNQDYEQKKRECWEEFKRTNLDGEVQWQPVSRYDVFCAAFDRAFALGKQEKDAEDTVISGWVARDEVAIRPTLYTSKPLRQKKGFENGYWSYGMQIGLSLDPSLFPDLTWESDPEPVEITIKRKNHEWRTD